MATVEEVYEGEVTRKVTRRTSYKIEETSSSTKTSTMTTGQTKLYGKDLNEYDEIDVEALLSQLSPEEISMLAKEVDPDDSFLPPSQRCSYECQKSPTGPLDRKKLIEHINKQAMETPDKPELKPYVPGTIRGKKWVPPPQPPKMQEAEEQIAIDMGDEYEQALSDATQEEIIDLAAILGFHSMMNQDQYHASLLNKGQPVGLGWDGITKATQPKAYPADPPNDTDVDKTLQMVKDDSPDLVNLNWNNIKNVSDEKFYALFNALKDNTHLETLSLVNTGLADRHGLKLAEALEKNCTLKILSVETNFLTPAVILRLIKSLLVQRSLEEFRGANQRRYVLGNKIETEITKLVEENPTLLRLGLHLEYNDARQRIATHLQRNIDRIIHHHEKPPKEYHPEYKEDPVPEWKLDTILAKKKPPRPEDIMYAVEDISAVLKESDARRRRSGPVLHPTEMKPPEGSELEPDLNQGEEAHDEPDGVTDPQSQES